MAWNSPPPPLSHKYTPSQLRKYTSYGNQNWSVESASKDVYLSSPGGSDTRRLMTLKLRHLGPAILEIYPKPQKTTNINPKRRKEINDKKYDIRAMTLNSVIKNADLPKSENLLVLN